MRVVEWVLSLGCGSRSGLSDGETFGGEVVAVVIGSRVLVLVREGCEMSVDGVHGGLLLGSGVLEDGEGHEADAAWSDGFGGRSDGGLGRLRYLLYGRLS